MKALIFKTKVVQLSEETFPVHKTMQWKDAHEGVKVGDTYKSNSFIPQPVPPQVQPTYKQLREQEYPKIGDQLDAIMKQLNYDRLNGRELIQDMDDILGEVLAVKARYPKPEG